MVLASNLVNSDLNKKLLNCKMDKVTDDMDVPKITVFKSPPWIKPVHPVITSTLRLSDVYEEFPAKTKGVPRRITTNISHSLECIPENMVLQDTHKYSTSHLRDNNRLSPHQILPPIQRYPDEDLPEMRQRAHSDPHKYTGLSKKKLEEKKESPLTKSVPTPSPLPPKEKSHDTKRSNVVVSPGNKVQRRVGGGTKTPTRSPAGTPPHHFLSDFGRNNSPLTIKPPRGFVADRDKPHHLPLRKKSTDGHSNPSTLENYRVTRNKKLINKNLSNDSVIAHPPVEALKISSQPRSRTNSMPTALKNDNIPRRKVNNRQPIILHDEVKTSVAYALIGSPGRNRWPSPERDATSYINSDDSSSPRDTPIEEERLSSVDSFEAIYKPHPPQDIDEHASDEFKTILKDFKSNASDELTSILDPKEYFQKMANWKPT